MKTTKLLCALLISLQIFLSSCATLFSGTKDRIVINSTPPGCDVYIEGVPVGKTGQDIVLHRKHCDTRKVNLRKDGYEDLNFEIEQQVAGAYWLNVPLCFAFLIPGAVGFIVDLTTGAAMKPKQTEFNRVLTQKK